MISKHTSTVQKAQKSDGHGSVDDIVGDILIDSLHVLKRVGVIQNHE